MYFVGLSFCICSLLLEALEYQLSYMIVFLASNSTMPAFYNSCFLVRVYSHHWKTKLFSSLGCCGVCFCAVIRLMMEKLKHKCRPLFGSCLGSSSKPPRIIAVDETSKRLRDQGHVEEDFGSSSWDMDNSVMQSQRSASSDPQSSAGITSNPTEFVNPGPILWNQTRQQWIENKRSQAPTQTQERKISLNATYESLLGTNEPFPQPIPLPVKSSVVLGGFGYS